MKTILDFEPLGEIKDIATNDYGVSKEDLQEMVSMDTAIQPLSIDDKYGYEMTKLRVMEYVHLRNKIDKRRKILGEEARKSVEFINDSAKELQLILSPGERHVTALINQVDTAKARKAQAERDVVFNARNTKLLAAGCRLERFIVDNMTDDQIDQKCAEAVELAKLRKEQMEREAALEAERLRILAEEKEQIRIESDRLARERAELDRKWQLEQEARKIEFDALSDARRRLQEENDRFQKLLDKQTQIEDSESRKDRVPVAEQQGLMEEQESAKLKAVCKDSQQIEQEPFLEFSELVLEPTLESREQKFISGIKAVEFLICESSGVAGLHLNGNLASWDELRTGGQFEEWLLDFDEALRICSPISKIVPGQPAAAADFSLHPA